MTDTFKMDMFIDNSREIREDILSHTKPTKKDEPTHRLFSIDESEFNLSTYRGRFMRNRLICNLFIAFYSNSRIVEM